MTHLIVLSVVLFVITAVGSLLAVGWIIVNIPADYFARKDPPPMFAGRHPIIRWVLIILKNLLGYFLIALGVILSLPGVPGQGLLTMFIGIMLLDFPGRKRFERWLVSRRSVLSGINRIRAKWGREPLQVAGDARNKSADIDLLKQ